MHRFSPKVQDFSSQPPLQDLVPDPYLSCVLRFIFVYEIHQKEPAETRDGSDGLSGNVSRNRHAEPAVGYLFELVPMQRNGSKPK